MYKEILLVWTTRCLVFLIAVTIWLMSFETVYWIVYGVFCGILGRCA